MISQKSIEFTKFTQKQPCSQQKQNIVHDIVHIIALGSKVLDWWCLAGVHVLILRCADGVDDCDNFARWQVAPFFAPFLANLLASSAKFAVRFLVKTDFVIFLAVILRDGSLFEEYIVKKPATLKYQCQQNVFVSLREQLTVEIRQ